MTTSKNKKVSFYKEVTLVYRCGCHQDKVKVNVLRIDIEQQFASRVKCKDCM